MDKERTIKIGSEVEYSASFGCGAYRTAEVVKIEKVAPGEKYGVELAEIPWDERESCVFDLSDSHWCYGDQIESLIGVECACGYCGEGYDNYEDRDRCGCKGAVKARRIDFEIDMADAIRKGED